ncbi:MAG: sensor histidine kinase [Dehalococcoidia bacterium]
MLDNLLSNAVRSTAPAVVPIRVRVAPHVGSDRRCVSLAVEDRGIRRARCRPALFERFHRAANAATLPGTGLGLAAVKANRSAARRDGRRDLNRGRGHDNDGHAAAR